MSTLLKALDYLKREIERNEAKLKTANGYGRENLERINEWLFERGINIIQYTSPEEEKEEAVDFFLGRIEYRPDIKKIEKRWREEDRLEEEAKKSLKGKVKLWLRKACQSIRYWWLE